MSLRHKVPFRTWELPVDKLGFEIDSRSPARSLPPPLAGPLAGRRRSVAATRSVAAFRSVAPFGRRDPLGRRSRFLSCFSRQYFKIIS